MGKDEAKAHLQAAIKEVEAARDEYDCGWCIGRTDAVLAFMKNLHDTTDIAVQMNQSIGGLDKKKIEIEYAEYERLVAAAQQQGVQPPKTLARPQILPAAGAEAPKEEQAAGFVTRVREGRGIFRQTIRSVRETVPRPKDLFGG